MKDPPLYYEQHNSKQSLILEKNKIEFFLLENLKHTIKKLTFLYLEEKDRIENILHKIRKDVVGLNFDEIILPKRIFMNILNSKKKIKKS